MEKEKTQGYSVLIRNLKYSTRASEVREAFECFGKIRDVYLPQDYSSGMPRGFGFVEFVEEAAALDAIRKMDNTTFNGKVITCCEAQDRRKSPNSMRRAYPSSNHRYQANHSQEHRNSKRGQPYGRPRSRSRSLGMRYRKSPSYERRYPQHRDDDVYHYRRDNEHSPEQQRVYRRYGRERARSPMHRDDRDYREPRGRGTRHHADKPYPEAPYSSEYSRRGYDRRSPPPRRRPSPSPDMIPAEAGDGRSGRPMH
ncbi:RNA recognition motif domain containing protein [Babesia bovis T2Bo]|uniref:RNA recognition motif containing protein n=1 Tax=Babesia bovis TaxID=5865 RepID=A7AT82_BABBO|nr:RNA recognition motif domain containing protein [Babesia bovis T2Bo]EDO06143.1 RNA recognition motif domain containing protein [Babesia bovis T2Bo]BAN64441.1 RNA recognition motif containing protein [Babesia bovis]|eukprot:XP_001609711.1 RNA recognition motif containing protein [Babesia bovis T2Bo]